MATAKKTSSGKYRIRVYDYTDFNGKKIYRSFTAETKQKAELLAAQYKAGRTHSCDLITLNECIDEYIKLKTAVLSPSTIKKYKHTHKSLKSLYPAILSRRIDQITQNDVQGLISDLSLTRSPATVYNYYALLTVVSERIKAFNITLPKLIKYEAYIPTEFEMKSLLAHVKGTEIELPIVLASSCMMRRGEIAALTMQDINFRNNTIHIRHSMVLDDSRNWVKKSPKTVKSDRIIKVPDFVINMIKEKGYITKYTPDQLTDNFERRIKEAGIHPFRFHDLRHYCASVFHYKGVPMSYVQKYGGWSTLNTLTQIYQHTLPDKENEIFEKMNNYFSDAFENV